MRLRNAALSIVIFLGMLLGFLLPQQGLFFKPFLSYFLMLLMFLTCLKIDVSYFRKINVKTIVAGLFFVIIFMPFLSLGGKLISSMAFTGMLLAFSCPSAASSTFYSDAFGGSSSLAVTLATLSNIASLVTLPLTVLIGVGSSISFDSFSIILNLVQIILLPLLAALLLRKISAKTCEKLTNNNKIISYVIILFILWGGVASGVSYIQSNIYDFLELNLLITLLLSVAFLIPYSMSRFFGKKYSISIAITSSMKNGILALVIGSAAFSPQILPALVANMIDQNIILMIVGLFKHK